MNTANDFLHFVLQNLAATDDELRNAFDRLPAAEQLRLKNVVGAECARRNLLSPEADRAARDSSA